MMTTVVFDLDGTLLDRDTSLVRFVQDQYDRLSLHGGLTVGRDAYVRRFVELDRRGYVWKDQVYRQLTEEFALPLNWEALLQDYILGFQQHCVGFPNLHETLDSLKGKGIKLGLISNGYGEFQYNNIKGLGIEPYFDLIVISEWEGLRKPDPRIFANTLSRLESKAGESIYVGDHPDNDVTASRLIGMKGIWKRDPYYDRDFAKDGEISDLLEILHYLKS
ncbi:HAD family hydrolase [Paenibacillus sp. Y412MC10]|uniref:HAD family hydrolase n=1 Tax=Geobacillus sp. (strain Y412MC10) TaxID=481743 RepID=UPI00119E6FBE|nr:HAD family hydrolase [Paenibacillus sp. Y412MC10]